MTERDFLPFIPAKPKGFVANEIAAKGGMAVQPRTAAEIVGKPPEVTAVVESTFKQKRKRRTREEMQAAKPNGSAPAPVDSFAVYVKIVELLEPVTQKVRMEIVRMLMDYHT